MHMADALLSPTTGGVMWSVSAGAIVYCSRRVRSELDERKVPLMGVLGAFIFAAQMINFTIPGTGSSGHLGGGLLLAILLGPHAAFLTIASVLVVQALFFADGGLLALGCNIFNLGIFPAFVAYPLCYRPFASCDSKRFRTTAVTIVAAVIGLLLGAAGVVVETVASGLSQLPLTTFLLFMLPIHLVIGIIEGTVTAAVVAFVRAARPEIVGVPAGTTARGGWRPVMVGFLVGSALIAGVLSWFASEKPDGLEWAVARVTGMEKHQAPDSGTHGWLGGLQQKLAIFPDYGFRKDEPVGQGAVQPSQGKDPGTPVAGLVGGGVTLAVAFLAGFVLKRRKR